MTNDCLIDTLKKTTFLTFLIIFSISLSSAQVRSSANYQIQSDSVNFAGGLSTSTNYSLESTAGEVGTGVSTSTIYGLYAGYQQMQEVFISISAVSPVEMLPSLGGITGGVSNGTTSVSVTTDSSGGYQLTISAENNPAMQNDAETITDYVPVNDPNPDISFTVDVNDVYFGFSPEGADVTDRWKNNGSVCNVDGVSTPLVCWDGLSTSEKVIAEGAANQPGGATTTLRFKVGIGSSAVVTAGTYVATSTLTALPL